MRKILNFIVVMVLVVGVNSLYSKTKEKETEEERMVRLLMTVLQDLPKKISSLKPEIRRVVFYRFKVDRKEIKPQLMRALEAAIENAFTKLPIIKLVNVPELKPLKVVIKEDRFSLSKGLNSLIEMKQLGEKFKVDGFLEADLFISNKNLYLNLRITEAENGGIVWSDNFFTKEVVPVPKEYATHVDFGVGMTWIQTSALTSTTLSVLSSTPFYTGELRISEPSWPTKDVDFILKGGLFLIADGTAFGGAAYIKTGLKFGMIKKQKKAVDGMIERKYWLSVEGDFGRVFPTGESGMTTFGIHFESDISRHFSIGAGFSYLTPIEVINSGTTIKVGGVSYDIFAIRFYF